jgi:hypothetical protein
MDWMKYLEKKEATGGYSEVGGGGEVWVGGWVSVWSWMQLLL